MRGSVFLDNEGNWPTAVFLKNQGSVFLDSEGKWPTGVFLENEGKCTPG